MLPRLTLFFTLLVACSACDSSEPGDPGPPPTPEDPVVAGVNLDELLAPPTAEELASVAADLSERASVIEPVAFSVENPFEQDGATVQVVSFGVTGLDPASESSSAFFGAIRTPDRPPGTPGRLPVLFVFPDGTDGVSTDDFLTSGPYTELGERFIQVLIAPPGEALQADGEPYASRALPDAFPILFDYEVDIARALLKKALGNPEADSNRFGAVGFGRGATVALLLAERPSSSSYPFTPRAVADLAGFSDFRAPSFRDVIRRLLLDERSVFPGSGALAARILHPLRDRILPLEDAREALLLRSPIYFAEALPQVFIQHGADDFVIDDDHSARLIGDVQNRATFPPAFPHLGHDDLFSDEGVQRDLARFLIDVVADGA